VSSQPPGLIRWLLLAQCTIGEAAGLQLTLRDWGAPTEAGEEQAGSEPYFGASASRPTTASGRGAAPPVHAPPPSYGAPPPADISDGYDAMPPPGFAPVPPPVDGAPSPRGYGGPPPQSASWGSERQAHEDSMAGARAARMRNEGSFKLGDGGWGESAPPSARGVPSRAPWEGAGGLPGMGGPIPGMAYEAPPSRGGYGGGGGGGGGFEPERPGTASSMASLEAARIRKKNEGSNIFG
jgi:hypothetical protein